MTAFGESNFLQALGWAVLNSLWQMALLWVVFQIVTGLYKKISSAGKSMLASALLMTGFGWFLFTFASILFSQAEPGAATLVAVEGNDQLNNWLRKTLPVASIIYLILLILPLVHFIRNYRYVQAIREYGLSKADVELRMFVKKIAAQLGIKKPVKVWVSELVTSPVTIGYLKPVILIPMAAVNHLSTQQMEAVLLHELSHIRRFDYFINLIIKFIQSVLYFNPFVKAFIKIVEREREKSCDEMVIQFQYDPHGYATALLELEKTNYLPKTLAVAAAGKKNDLLHRIEWIMGVQKKKQVISFNKVASVFAGLLCIIGLNAMLILSKPSEGRYGPGFAELSSPFYFFVDDAQKKPATPAIPATETTKELIVNHSREEKQQEQESKQIAQAEKIAPATPVEFMTPYATEKTSQPFIPVSVFKPVIPVLAPFEEAQVREALAASKILLKEGQWKAVENKIAEVFTMQEKELLKAQMDKELNKQLDLSKWETSMKIAYDKVNWEKVNGELNAAMSKIALDSVQQLYTRVLSDLSQVEKEMKAMNETSIPDTDLTLRSIEQKKSEVEKAINIIRAVKTKKVVHL